MTGSLLRPHRFHGEEQLAVAEDDGSEGDGEAEEEEEHDVGLVVVLVVRGVPVRPAGALQSFWDIPAQEGCISGQSQHLGAFGQELQVT